MMDAISRLAGLRYPGRGILFGKTQDGAYAAAVYFITGRSVASRSRILLPTADGAVVKQTADAGGDPSLLLYTPIRRCGGSLIVTNGDQTDTVYMNISPTAAASARRC